MAHGDWKGRKVLVTGAEGFIGSHLVEQLVALGARVRAFVLYNSFPVLSLRKYRPFSRNETFSSLPERSWFISNLPFISKISIDDSSFIPDPGKSM